MDLKNLKITALINLFSAFQIPLLAFVTPKIVEVSENKSVARIRLGLRTRNHLGVMYFGALGMGAELSVALAAILAIQDSGKKIDFIFKDFKAEFLKRADSNVHFICDEARDVRQLVMDAAATSERISRTFNGYAIVPSKSEEPVMKYSLTLSVKQRSKKS
jgi:hypothetical protein